MDGRTALLHTSETNMRHVQDTISIQAISTVFTDQIGAYLVLKTAHFIPGIKIFNILPPSVTIRTNDDTKSKAVLRKYKHTNTHTNTPTNTPTHTHTHTYIKLYYKSL